MTWFINNNDFCLKTYFFFILAQLCKLCFGYCPVYTCLSFYLQHSSGFRNAFSKQNINIFKFNLTIQFLMEMSIYIYCTHCYTMYLFLTQYFISISLGLLMFCSILIFYLQLIGNVFMQFLSLLFLEFYQIQLAKYKVNTITLFHNNMT